VFRLTLGHESVSSCSYFISRLSLTKSLTDLEVSALIVTPAEGPMNLTSVSMDELKEFKRVVSYSFVEV
jgi:hypothetical protein